MGLLVDKRVLLCQPFFEHLSGSEVIALELSQALADQGADVTIATWLFSDDLARELPSTVSLVQLGTPAFGEYVSQRVPDLTWCHQGLIPEELFEVRTHFVFTHLSSFNSFEFSFNPLIERSLADRVYVVSAEALHEQQETGIFEHFDEDLFRLLENPAPRSFHELEQETATTEIPPLKSLLVVSNHLPSEERDAISLLRHDGVSVEVVGMAQPLIDAHPTRVDADLLDKFDAVMTIGKTVQYGLCAGKPVYCYDYFGGPGWLNEDNLQAARFHNFSGRGFATRSAQSIAREIRDDFAEAFRQSIALRPLARDQFSYDRVINDIVTLLESTSAVRPSVERASTVGYIQAHKTIRDFGVGYHASRRQLASPDEEITRLSTELTLKQTHVVNLESIVASHEATITGLTLHLDDVIAARDANSRDVANLTNTLSWKITAPLRRIRALLRGSR